MLFQQEVSSSQKILLPAFLPYFSGVYVLFCLWANCILSQLTFFPPLLQLLFQWRHLCGWNQFLHLPVSLGVYGTLLPHRNQWVWLSSLPEQGHLCGQPGHIQVYLSLGLHWQELQGGWLLVASSAQGFAVWAVQQQSWLGEMWGAKRGWAPVPSVLVRGGWPIRCPCSKLEVVEWAGRDLKEHLVPTRLFARRRKVFGYLWEQVSLELSRLVFLNENQLLALKMAAFHSKHKIVLIEDRVLYLKKNQTANKHKTKSRISVWLAGFRFNWFIFYREVIFNQGWL